MDGDLSEAEDEVEGRLLLDVVVRKGAAVLELLTGENQTLLVRGNSFLVLDLGLDVLDGVRRLDLEGDRLTGEGLDKDLHTTTKAEHKVEGRLLLDVVIRKRPPVLELLASKDKTLLVRGDTLLVLDLGLDVLDRVRRLNLKGDGLPSKSLDKNLHNRLMKDGSHVLC